MIDSGHSAKSQTGSRYIARGVVAEFYRIPMKQLLSFLHTKSIAVKDKSCFIPVIECRVTLIIAFVTQKSFVVTYGKNDIIT